jgi:diguanylate cyclase (GGDEF)-like protein
MPLRRDSYSLLRETLRWRVALVLGVLIMALMAALGILNTHLGLTDTALLAWIVLGLTSACVTALLTLPRQLGGTIFFCVIAAALLVVPAYGLQHGRNMQHWAYILPPVMVFLMRAGPALVVMLIYGVYVTLVSTPVLPGIDVVRFASGYGLLVCFLYTYALLQERAAAMLRYHSDHDALTNCLNRRTFNETLEQLSRPGAASRSCAILLIDIDHFKSINDQHGHLVGDRVITQVAAELGRQLDRGVPLFRYGGEEFAIIVSQTEPAATPALAETLRQAIAHFDFQGIAVTVSIGLAHWQSSQGSLASAIARADRALYAAKNAGRNRVVVDSAAIERASQAGKGDRHTA